MAWPLFSTSVAPPVAPRRPHPLEAHGTTRVDDWWWLRDREDPEVIAYLEAENRYADACLAPTIPLQEQLYEEIRSRIQEDDVSAPSRDGAWWYWSATANGAQYRSYHRLADPQRLLDARAAIAAARRGDGTTILDENALAAASSYMALGVFDVSSDHRTLAYATDLDGSEQYRLAFRDLESGAEHPDVVEGVQYGSAWASDNETFFYVRPDAAMRPYQVWRHQLGAPAERDRLVYEEPDQRFAVSVGLTRSKAFVVIHTASKSTSESSWIDAASPSDVPRTVMARAVGVEYDLEHARLPGAGDVWLVRSNAPAPDGTPSTNFAVTVVPVGASTATGVLLAHDEAVTIESVEAFAGHIVATERSAGLEQLRVVPFDGGTWGDAGWRGDSYVVQQPDAVWSLTGATNAEWDATTYRFGYTSLVTPMSTIDHVVATSERVVVKVQEVLGGYRPEDYRTERITARAPDGTAVPISLVCRRDQPLDQSAACLLYGYGAYEISVDPMFSPARLNLLERGVVFAIAHVRGGGEMGRIWYEEGRLDAKTNTFTDFVACAKHLVAKGWSSPSRLAIRGGSAGGLLVGAVLNMAPEMFAAAVAEVPFVDVVTTMSDESLPLTIGEWEEWGDPVRDVAAYERMVSYSPYDNVRPASYPAMYVTAGLTDPRVGFFEPAKWVAKLRSTTTGSAPIVLRTEMGAGHQGSSGRYDAWRDEARVQAFLLASLGAVEMPRAVEQSGSVARRLLP